jgi:hypothetical protein
MRSTLTGLVAISILSFCVGAHAADPIASVLTQLHRDPALGFKTAEREYKEAKDTATAARLATMLAFAPAGQSETPAYLYAQFAFFNDRTLSRDLKVKLAKLAGEGLFNQSQFKKTARIFERALRIPDLSIDEREYFHYQLAWCDLNMKNPENAVQRLADWTSGCPECRLHKEMITDLGKAFAESKVKAGDIVRKLASDSDREAFMDGYVAEIHRTPKFKLYSGTERFLGTALIKEWLLFALSDKRFEDQTPCARIDALSTAPAGEWPVDRARSDFRNCALHYLKDKKPVPSALRAGYEMLPSQNQFDLLLLSSLWEREGVAAKACRLRLDASGLNPEPDAKEVLKPEVFLTAILTSCRPVAKEVSTEIAELMNRPSVAANLGAEAAKWYGIYLDEISGVEDWRKAFASKPIEEVTKHADAETEKRLLADSRWSLAWRKSLWEVSAESAALDDQVLSALAREFYSNAQDYADFIGKVEARSRKPRAVVALLRSRTPGRKAEAKALYEEAKAIDDWQALSGPERRELLSGVLLAENTKRVLADWPHWKPLIENDTEAFQTLLGHFTDLEAGTVVPPSGDSPEESILKAFAARNSDPTVEIPFSGATKSVASDIAFLNQTIATHKALRNPDSAKNLISVEAALDKISKTLKNSRKHKWKVAGLGRIHRRELKESLAAFHSELTKAAPEDAATYEQLAQLVSDWEKKL